MDVKTVIKLALLALPIVRDITSYFRNKSEERVMEKSITLKTLQKEELIDPLYIVED